MGCEQAIEWFDLQDLPTWYRRRTQQSRPAKFFMITPFVAYVLRQPCPHFLGADRMYW